MRPVLSYLRGSACPLTEQYDVALLDLDGVVYIGPEAVPGAPEALAAARAAGMRLAFVTNNAARPPEAVAAHLTELGIAADPSEVVTSAQAAARYLADRLPRGARVLVVGTTGLEVALRERGLHPVWDAKGHVDAVVQGYSPDLTWQQLAEGAIAINRGVPWVATNIDPTVPSPRGNLPGNGSLVAALRHATGATPIVTGKPDPAMHRESVLRSGARRPIVVGDRLDTDIEGANAVGCASVLVLSGVTSPRELLAAPAARRPTYLASEVGGLLRSHQAAEVREGAGVCGAWRATPVGSGDEGRLRLAPDRDTESRPTPTTPTPTTSAPGPAPAPTPSPSATADDLDALRALCAAAWAADPGNGSVRRVVVEPDGATADERRAAAELIARLDVA